MKLIHAVVVYGIVVCVCKIEISSEWGTSVAAISWGWKNNPKCGRFLFIALQYVWPGYILTVTLCLHLCSICAIWYYYVLYPLL